MASLATQETKIDLGNNDIVIDINYSDIDTGDILLLTYSEPITVFNQGVICTQFIHASLCSREGSNLYVYEFGNYFGKKIGFLKLSFSEWIKYNKNCMSF